MPISRSCWDCDDDIQPARAVRRTSSFQCRGALVSFARKGWCVLSSSSLCLQTGFVTKQSKETPCVEKATCPQSCHADAPAVGPVCARPRNGRENQAPHCCASGVCAAPAEHALFACSVLINLCSRRERSATGRSGRSNSLLVRDDFGIAKRACPDRTPSRRPPSSHGLPLPKEGRACRSGRCGDRRVTSGRML